MFVFITFLAAFVSTSPAQTNSCVAVKTIVKSLKSGSSPKVYENIYPNEPLKVLAVTKDKKHTKVSLGGEAYWVNVKEFTTLDSSQCSLKMCVYLPTDTMVQSRPNKSATTQIIDEGVFPVVTKVKSWYRVKLGSGYVWLTGSQLKNHKQDCEAPVSDSVKTQSARSANKMGWLFGVEAGYIFNVSGEPLQNLLTTLPDSTTDVNDDAFDSPFIESVTDGSGWYAGVTTEFPMFWGLRNRIALGYKTRTLEYIQRQNPHNASVSFITYDQLVPETVSQDFSFVYGTTTMKYEGWEFLGLVWQPGVTLGIDYSLDEFVVEFRTAPLKLTPYYVESGYQTIEFLYGPRLDINIGFFNLGLQALLTSYGMEPTASLGLQF
jgi:hypothetical protein